MAESSYQVLSLPCSIGFAGWYVLVPSSLSSPVLMHCLLSKMRFFSYLKKTQEGLAGRRMAHDRK
jgi:hypothetical protein